MANTVINLRRGNSPFWISGGAPSGVNGYSHGLVSVSGNFNTNGDFVNTLDGKAEPWVNTNTKQLFVDGTCINPGLKLKINGGNASDVTLKYDENYKVYYDLNINYSDQYLKKVANITIPGSDDDSASTVFTRWFRDLGIIDEETTLTVSLNSDSEWQVTVGENNYTFNPGKNYIGFTWNTEYDVTTPTFLEVPDTDTTYGADRGISLVNGNFGHENSITGGTSTPSINGSTLKVPAITYDNYGHITTVAMQELTLPQPEPTDPAAAHVFRTKVNTSGSETSFELQEKLNGAEDSTYSPILKMRQEGCDDDSTTTYNGSLISFRETSQSATDNIVLVNVDIIDGGSFN